LLKETENSNGGGDDDDDDDGNTNNKHIVQTLLVFNSRPTTISANAPPPPVTHFPNWIIFLNYKHARKLPRPGIGNAQYIGLNVRAIRHLAL